jgi:hypothetical protein
MYSDVAGDHGKQSVIRPDLKGDRVVGRRQEADWQKKLRYLEYFEFVDREDTNNREQRTSQATHGTMEGPTRVGRHGFLKDLPID